ncbi:MAG: (Fe-S)-binding protein [Promethearchaeota archaeon]
MNEDEKEILVSNKHISLLQTIELTSCTRCGVCGDVCPTYQQSKNIGLIPAVKLTFMKDKILQKSLLRRIFGRKPLHSKDLTQKANDLYGCTLCGACTAFCPLLIDVRSLWPTFRMIVNESNFTPESVRILGENVKKKENPYGVGEDLREFWIDSAELDYDPVKEKTNLIYFIGCTSAFKNQNEMIPISIAKILEHTGEDWAVLGNEEVCCGAPSLMSGDEITASKLALRNLEMIEDREATTLVTGCAGCYRMFKWEYPQLLGKKINLKVLHAVELLSQYILEGKIQVELSDLKITYHDPCELGRLGGILDEPRFILNTITRNFVELPENKVQSKCCGGGGLLQVFDPEMAIKISSLRIKQAEQIEVNILTSACPACEMALKEAAQRSGSTLKVLDIAELVAKQLALIPE